MPSWKRDAAAALALAAIATCFAFAGCEGGDSSAISRPYEASGLPPGWHEIHRPITGVIYPTQVFAASTYPIVLRHRPRSCTPHAAVEQMPPGGVLLQVIEYTPTDESGRKLGVPKLPPRPNRFTYRDGVYASYECDGPSYKFAYRQGGHALQAQIWMHRGSVDRDSRAQALRILDGFRPLTGTGEGPSSPSR